MLYSQTNVLLSVITYIKTRSLDICYRILSMWYTHQKMCIKWGNAISPSFTVSNGIKQGGIISPILFNVYMDGLSVLSNISNIGGQIGYTFLNHLCYADDLCLISLSSAGMQKLLNLCSKYAVDNSLTYNAKKSFSLCFIPRIEKRLVDLNCIWMRL